MNEDFDNWVQAYNDKNLNWLSEEISFIEACTIIDFMSYWARLLSKQDTSKTKAEHLSWVFGTIQMIIDAY